MRSVEDDAHGETTDSTGDRNSHDPGEDEETNSLPVDGLDGSIAETDANSGTSDAHGGRDGERVLRKDQDGKSSAHLHGATSTGGVVGDLVTHDLHDVVAIGGQAEGDAESHDSELPDGDGELGGGGVAGGPGGVHDCPRADGVSFRGC